MVEGVSVNGVGLIMGAGAGRRVAGVAIGGVSSRTRAGVTRRKRGGLRCGNRVKGVGGAVFRRCDEAQAGSFDEAQAWDVRCGRPGVRRRRRGGVSSGLRSCMRGGGGAGFGGSMGDGW